MASRVVAPEARQDLRLIISAHDRPTALTILGRVRASFDLLGRHPFIGRDRADDLGLGLRSLPSGSYIIVYRATSELVTILRVIDGRRDYPKLFRP